MKCGCNKAFVTDSLSLALCSQKPPVLNNSGKLTKPQGSLSCLGLTGYTRSFPAQHAAQAPLRSFIPPILLLSHLLFSCCSLSMQNCSPICMYICMQCSWDLTLLKATTAIHITKTHNLSGSGVPFSVNYNI